MALNLWRRMSPCEPSKPSEEPASETTGRFGSPTVDWHGSCRHFCSWDTYVSETPHRLFMSSFVDTFDAITVTVVTGETGHKIFRHFRKKVTLRFGTKPWMLWLRSSSHDNSDSYPYTGLGGLHIYCITIVWGSSWQLHFCWKNEIIFANIA